jgi:hypothetical protein
MNDEQFTGKQTIEHEIFQISILAADRSKSSNGNDEQFISKQAAGVDKTNARTRQSIDRNVHT